MGVTIVFVCLVLSTHAASLGRIIAKASQNTTSLSSNTTSATPKQNSASTTPIYNQELLSPPPPSGYQVTENVIDIPDDRTLAPIVPTYGILTPLNLANTSINVTYKNEGSDVGDEEKLKKTSFTYIHYSKEPPEKKSENAFVKLFRGVKNYVVGFKKSWIDGIHAFVHSRDDKDKNKKGSVDDFLNGVNGKKIDEEDFYDSYHGSSDSEECFGYDDDDDEDDDDFKHEFER